MSRYYSVINNEYDVIFNSLGIERQDFVNQTLPVLIDTNREERIKEYTRLASEEICLQECMDKHRNERRTEIT